MNYKQIREEVWNWAGLPTTDGRQDNILQAMRNAVNQTHNECFIATPFWWFNIQRWTLSVVSGTAAYEINDWCRLPTRVWVEGTSAGPVDFISPQETDRQGLRSDDFVEASDGPYQFTFKEVRKTATMDLVGNATVGNTVITRTSGDTPTSSHVGNRLRINGEPADYKITDVTGNAITVDKAYQAVLVESEGVSGTGSNTTGGAIEISPGPVWRVDFMPKPSSSETVYVWGAEKERYMTADTDVPELPERWHEVIVIGTERRLCRLLRRPVEEMNVLKSEYEHLLGKMRKVDLQMGGPRRMSYESSFKGRFSPLRTYRPANDIYPYRGRGRNNG